MQRDHCIKSSNYLKTEGGQNYLFLGEGKSDNKPTGRRGSSAMVGTSPGRGKCCPQTYSERKTGKAPGHSEVSLELIAASGGVLIQMMAKICQSRMDLECQLNRL